MSYKLLFFLLISPIFCFGQKYLPFSQEGKWGIIDQNNTILVEAEYQCATPIKNASYFRIGKNNKLGLIDPKGNTILPIQYQRIEYIDDNIFIVWEDDGAYLINHQQQKLNTTPYQYISPFDPYLKIHNNNKEGILSKRGQLITPIQYEHIEKQQHVFITKSGLHFGFLNSKGKEQIAPKYNNLDFLDQNHLVGSISGGPLKEVFVLDKEGTILDKKSFSKPRDLTLYQESLYLKSEAQKVKNARVQYPQWVDIMGDKYLVAPTGKVILNNAAFFYVHEDPKSGLTIARREEAEGEYAYYLIDQKKGRPLFKDSFKDIVLDDYNYSEWARITIDTLWDALINKEGTVKRQINNNGNDYKIHNIGNFYDQRAWFKTHNGKYGVIDSNAKVVIPPIYNVISDFNNQQAVVQKNHAFGLINTDGEIIVPITYNGFSKLHNGWYTVKKGNGSLGKWGIINEKGQSILPCKYDKIYLDDKGANTKLNGKWGRYLKSNKWAFQPKIPVDEMHPFTSSISRIQRKPKYDPIDRKTLIGYQLEGYIDEKGNIIIPPIYNEIIGFEKAWEKKEGIGILKKGNKVGYVNYLGEVVLEAKYLSAEGFVNIWSLHDGAIVVKTKDNTYNAVDYNGHELLTEEFDFLAEKFIQIHHDSSGVCIAGVNSKKGLIDFEGKRQSPFIYQQLFELDNSHFIAQKDNKWGIIAANGDTLSAFEHTKSAPLYGTYAIKYLTDSSAQFKITSEGKWESGKFDTPSKVLLDKSHEYKYYHIDSDYAIVSKKGKSKLMGVIDASGKSLTKFEFKKIGPFREGLAFAQKDGKTAKDRKYGFINKKGKWIISAKYNKAKSFSNGRAAVNMKNKWGYVNPNGEVIIPIKYNQAEDFKGTIAEVDHHYLIDLNGKQVGSINDEEQLLKSKHGKGIVKGIGYQQHIFYNGLALSARKFDEVTLFNASGIAFVKTGDVWELTRKINKTTTKKKFTKFDMELYLSKFGNKRRVVSSTGDVAQDMGFEKIKSGKWRMIGIDGQPLNSILFNNVTYLEEDDEFIVETTTTEEIVNFDGETLTKENVLGSRVTPNNQIIIIDQKGNNSLLKNKSKYK
ncbi:WG repeat-containing protein [Flammeovirga pacifica]|uniref:WG repeat-containing protein n=1 Tax=Flammeovirga pacifica TaxID=915059 RepID=A0A1S1Z440_FLAPC|nr:WG repeat-containing protein [Flammeovirga pacifica]OHX68040.1 hypothetical protein NH26_17670 [Flammeovirga pacifica]